MQIHEPLVVSLTRMNSSFLYNIPLQTSSPTRRQKLSLTIALQNNLCGEYIVCPTHISLISFVLYN